MSGIKLTDEYFKAAALDLRCDLSAIKAVAHVETKNAGFDSKGRPIILFERHVFFKYLKRFLGAKRRAEFEQICRDNPDICNSDPGNYGATGENQWRKFSRAFAIHKEAAMMACSWGSFQEMGFNYADLGFDSVGQFVDVIKLGLEAHLVVFLKSVRAKGLVDEIRAKDFKTFARIYNGPAYKKNDYDTKMINAEDDYKFLNAKNITPAALTTIAILKKQTIRLSEMVEISSETGEVEADQSVQLTDENQIPALNVPDILNVESKVTGAIDDARTEINDQVGNVFDQTKAKVEEQLKDSVNQAKESAKNQAIDYVTQKLPNFAKTGRWLKGLSLTGFLGFFGSYFAGLPWWLMFGFGYLAGVASTAFVVFLLIKTNYLARVTVKVAEANADPLRNNIRLVQLPPAPGFIKKMWQNWKAAKESAANISINS